MGVALGDEAVVPAPRPQVNAIRRPNMGHQLPPFLPDTAFQARTEAISV
jgi:hypothetical protein